MTATNSVALLPTKVFYQPAAQAAAPNAVVEIARKEIHILAFMFIGISTGLLMASGMLWTAVVLSLSLLVYALIVKTAQGDFYEQNGSMNHQAKAIVYIQCLFWGTVLLAGVMGGLTGAAVFWGSYISANGSAYGLLLTLAAAMIFTPWCQSQMKLANTLNRNAAQLAKSFASLHARLEQIGDPTSGYVQGLLKVYQGVASEDTEASILGMVKEFKEEFPTLFRDYFKDLLPILSEELAVRIIHDHSNELLDKAFLEGLNQGESRLHFAEAYRDVDLAAPVQLQAQLQTPLLFLTMAKKAVPGLNHPLIAHLLNHDHAQLQNVDLFRQLASSLCNARTTADEMAWLLSSYPDLNDLTFIRRHFVQAQFNAYFYIDKLAEFETKCNAAGTPDTELLSVHSTLYQALHRLKPFETSSFLQHYVNQIFQILDGLDQTLEVRAKAALQEHSTNGTQIPDCWKGALSQAFFKYLLDSTEDTDANRDRIRELRSLQRQLS